MENASCGWNYIIFNQCVAKQKPRNHIVQQKIVT